MAQKTMADLEKRLKFTYMLDVDGLLRTIAGKYGPNYIVALIDKNIREELRFAEKNIEDNMECCIDNLISCYRGTDATLLQSIMGDYGEFYALMELNRSDRQMRHFTESLIRALEKSDHELLTEDMREETILELKEMIDTGDYSAFVETYTGRLSFHEIEEDEEEDNDEPEFYWHC